MNKKNTRTMALILSMALLVAVLATCNSSTSGGVKMQTTPEPQTIPPESTAPSEAEFQIVEDMAGNQVTIPKEIESIFGPQIVPIFIV